MSNQVYANGNEISCKSGAGKSICAFPDVCFTPPLTPATPPGVPIPYPNTGMTTDTSSGSKTVQISGKEVMLKNSSFFSTSTGDEAGSAPKKNVITSKIKGKCYFKAWSMDVKIEGKNVVRHLDMMTHNHASDPGATPPWPFMDSMAAGSDPCAKEKAEEEKACKDYKPKGAKDACTEAGLDGKVLQSEAAVQALGNANIQTPSAWADDISKKAAAHACISSRRCMMVRYKPSKEKPEKCCGAQTGDHIIPKSSFYEVSCDDGKKFTSWDKYNPRAAPVMCAEGGSNTVGSHGLRHSHHKMNGPAEGTMQSFDDQSTLAAKGAEEVFKSSGCSAACIKGQLENGHKDMGSGDVKHQPSGSTISNEDITSRATAYGAPPTR
ncbi:MAG: PAAR-like domain-containing protein [Gemmatales bacterium]